LDKIFLTAAIDIRLCLSPYVVNMNSTKIIGWIIFPGVLALIPVLIVGLSSILVHGF